MYFTDQYINNTMINFFKNFTTKKIAGLLLILVIIIAFGFGGFGGGFKGGNQNNIAKINNKNLTTQDFMDYLNQSGLSQQVIKENLDKNIIEELLSALISMTLLDLEVKDLELIMSEEILSKKIKRNKKFQDRNGKFKRTLYEKFLLENNMSAPLYEIKMKNNMLQKKLFTYISGGAKSPSFLINKYFKDQNRKLEINYISLDKFYKKNTDFSDNEIKIFINENSNELKQDYIDFSYVVMTPKNLTGLDDFNQQFFDEIDEIENKISKNIDFKKIVSELNIKPTEIKNYINLENKETIENKIYNSRNDKIEIIEDKGTFIFYQINKINNKLPDSNEKKFKAKIRNLLYQKEKYEFNKKILDQINNNEFNQTSFNNFGNSSTKKIKISSIRDNKNFTNNSIELLYSLPVNTFTLINDDKENIFIAKIIKFEDENISQNSKQFRKISNEASAKNRNDLLKSYDLLLSDKYKVVINEKTIDRVKNYFR